MTLPEIEQLVAPILKHYQTALDKMTVSYIPLIGMVGDHVSKSHGKQLRPLLALLTSCCCGLPLKTDARYPLFTVAAALETLHTATLIHDDVIDNSDLRRGNPTVNNIWGNKTAVLMGDYYLAQVMKILNDIDNKEITQIVTRTVISMSVGELMQQQYTGKYDTEESTYLEIIQNKTASLLSACCIVGVALSPNKSNTTMNAARQFGLEFGMAFQIRDDIMDFLPSNITGKPCGNDIKEHKCTLPIINLLSQCDPYTRERHLTILNKETITDDDIQSIIGIINASEAIEKSIIALEEHRKKALHNLFQLPDNQFREALISLTLNYASPPNK